MTFALPQLERWKGFLVTGVWLLGMFATASIVTEAYPNISDASLALVIFGGWIGGTVLWLILVFTLTKVPGFMPDTSACEDWDENWKIRDDFLSKPSTRVQLWLLTPVSLLFYLIRWGILGTKRASRQA